MRASSIVLAALALTLAGPVSHRAGAEEGGITAENWTEKVAFKPDLSTVECKPGTTIDRSNLQQFKELIPQGIQYLIRRYKMKIRVTGYEPVHPSEGYIQATNRYLGKAAVIDLGKVYDRRGIKGYVAGLPFPKPRTGLEVAWDFHYHYSADDGEVTYAVYWVSASGGVEHDELWKLSAIKGDHRTDIEPIPAVESLREKGLQGAGLTFALAPYDKKGLGAVYFSHVEPRDGQGHIYVPSMRRILRNSFGTRGDTWNSTDLFYEDVRGYSGYPEWMNWKLLGKKTVLLPMHSGVKLGPGGVKSAYDFDNWPHWNPMYGYEPRPVYLLEARPKLPDYPYSKQYLFVDAETFHVLYKAAYDRKGEIWKIMLNSGAYHRDMEKGRDILGWSGTVVIDLQSEHATVFHVHRARANLGLDPSLFTVSALQKRAR
jgi:hypothetical protein